MPQCEVCAVTCKRNFELSRHLLSKHRLLWTGQGTRLLDDAEYETRIKALRRNQMSARSRRNHQAAEFAAMMTATTVGVGVQGVCGRMTVGLGGKGATASGGPGADDGEGSSGPVRVSSSTSLNPSELGDLDHFLELGVAPLSGQLGSRPPSVDTGV